MPSFDLSKFGKNLDLTVTTAERVELGSIITLEGAMALNKDFGAGYRYDYIMEAVVISPISRKTTRRLLVQRV